MTMDAELKSKAEFDQVSFRRCLILGGTGFLGKSIALKLAREADTAVTLYARRSIDTSAFMHPNIASVSGDFLREDSFDYLLIGVDIVFHLVSPTNVSSTNQNVGDELALPIRATCKLLDSCVRMGVKRLVFISSGGTVYGDSGHPPFRESQACRPLSAYGMQKLLIEQILEFYQRMNDLDYRVVRVSNPYGPLQDPAGQVGVVTKAISNALNGEELVLFGDGSVVRDFVYIDDVVSGIVNVADYEGKHRVFNLGSGVGTSLTELLMTVEKMLDVKLRIRREPGRPADVQAVWLDMSRYEESFGQYKPVSLERGIQMTADYLQTKERGLEFAD